MPQATPNLPTVSALIAAAMAARKQAYAPYSNHPVGVALMTVDGTVHCGTNVENAAYPLGSCAEATAIGNMVLAGDTAQQSARMIHTIVVAGPGTDLCTPCGGCRQKIREFAAPNAQVVVCDVEGTILLECLFDSLLPHSFGPDNIPATHKS